MPWRLSLRRRRDVEIDEELASHLQMAIRERIEDGTPPSEAVRLARIECGNLTLAKEDTRAVRRWTTVEQLTTDLLIGARILWRTQALRRAPAAPTAALFSRLCGSKREFVLVSRRITGLGAHGAPARKRSGAQGSPRATEPGFGAEPRLVCWAGRSRPPCFRQIGWESSRDVSVAAGRTTMPMFVLDSLPHRQGV